MYASITFAKSYHVRLADFEAELAAGKANANGRGDTVAVRPWVSPRTQPLDTTAW